MTQITKLTADHYAKSGLTLFNKKLFPSALACFVKALNVNEVEPGERTPAFYAYLVGNMLYQMKRFDEAVIFLERAWMLDKSYADPVHILANLYTNTHEFDSAEAMFAAALALAKKAGQDTTDIELDTSLFKLFVGRYTEGFIEFEVRQRGREKAYVTNIPQWDCCNNILNKTLYVYAEQGIGDIIQFSRYLPHVRAYCARLIVGVPPELVPLFRAFPKSIIDEVIPRLVETPPPDDLADVCLPIVSAARLIPTIPPNHEYFRLLASSQSFELPLPADDTARKIGIVWSGNPTHSHDRERSVPLETFLPIASMTGVQLYSLQVGQRAGEVDLIGAQALIYMLTPELTNWVATAAALMRLDLVITVDTAVAHLAGALGIPTWLMISASPDWRWGPSGIHTPWYESVVLWRQQVGDWKGVVERIVQEISYQTILST